MKTIRQQMAENTRRAIESLRQMPKCECGHVRLRHGAYCDQSCTMQNCECDGYKPAQKDFAAYRKTNK